MDTPRSLEVSPARTPLDRLSRAARQIDGVSWFAMLAIFIGWFFLDTLVVGFGALRHGVRFFDISAAIADPTRIFFGVDGYLQRIFFGLVCFACLLAPLLPHWRMSRMAWVAYLAPLALMILCGALLYSKTASEFFPAAGDASPFGPNRLGRSVVGLANDLIRQGSDVVSRHIVVGAGAYLAFAGSVLLAVQAFRSILRACRIASV